MDRPLITPQEIDHVEDAGTLDKSPVKMIRTKGGFWIAIGKPRGKFKEEALAAGSHPAIVKYNVEKQYPGFQPSMMKSENLADGTVVDRHSHFLSDDLRKSGHDIYSVQNGAQIEFQITKHNSHVATVKGHLENDAVVIDDMKAPTEFAKSLAGAATEKALSCGASKIKIGK